MMIETMLVIKDDTKLVDGEGRYTVSGAKIFPLNIPIPVIAGKRCVGLATIARFLVSEDSTRVEFHLNTNINRESKEAYYTLYQQRAMMYGARSDLMYYDEAVFVPGAMGIGDGSRNKKSGSGKPKSAADDIRKRYGL